MKILYLIHQFFPDSYTGTEKIFLNLATMTQKNGLKVEVMTYSFNKTSFYDQSTGKIVFKEFIYKGIPVLALKHKKITEDIHQALEDRDLSRVASELISRKKPDVVHIAHSMRVCELAKASRHLNIPYIVTLTDFFLICPKYTLITSENTLCSGPEGGEACRVLCPELQTGFITRRLEIARDILFNASLVTSLSNFLANIFRKEFPTRDIKVVNPGLRYTTLKKNRKTYTKGDKIVFCYAGTLSSHKGVHILIDAFRKVASSDVILKIYGSGPDESYVSNLMTMAKKDQRIEFCNVYSDDQIGEILKAADVVIVPSLWYETYCLVMHEAFACNVPVIGSDVGVMAEKIENSVNGFLFEMGNSQQLKEVMERVLDDPAILNVLKRNINGMVIANVEQEAYAYQRAYLQINKPVS